MKVSGRWTYLYLAIDQHGQVVDGRTDHGRLKARLRPMRGLKRRGSARMITAGHAFVQNLRRGRYEFATDIPARHRLHEAFDQLVMTI